MRRCGRLEKLRVVLATVGRDALACFPMARPNQELVEAKVDLGDVVPG